MDFQKGIYLVIALEQCAHINAYDAMNPVLQYVFQEFCWSCTAFSELKIAEIVALVVKWA